MINIFEQTLHAHDRRQIIRHLIQLGKASDSVEQTIFLALKDEDWEVRVSAVIACARLQLVSLANDLLNVDIKIGAKYLPKKIDREIVFGIWQVAKMIVGQVRPEHIDPNNKKHQRWQKLYHCVQSPLTTIDDTISHLVYYFSTPNDISPRDDNENVVFNEKDDVVYLPNTTIEMAWVSPGDYWLGDSTVEHFSLEKVATQGFYMSCFPLLDEQDVPLLMSQQTLADQLKVLREETGLDTLAIPSPIQWQMAARGVDARCYPWGWGVEEDWSVSSAASGIHLFWLEQGEWAKLDEQWFAVNQFGKKANIQFDITASASEKKPCRIVYDPYQ